MIGAAAMSVLRDHGIIMFECDNCGDTFETKYSDFYAALSLAQKKGWQTIEKNNWKHYCPVCEPGEWEDDE
jgi:hypothetical protein